MKTLNKYIAYLAVVATVIAAAVVAQSSQADAETPLPPSTTPEVTTPPIVTGTTPTKKVCSLHKFRKYTKYVYLKDKISSRNLEKIYKKRRCLSRPDAKRALKFQRSLGVERRARLEIRRLTPYAGPNGTRWAVPYAIVRCESGGSWSADNPSSDARGPYQLLGHGEPWPASTPARKLAHHRIAGNLFRASGYGPWEASRGCWS